MSMDSYLFIDGQYFWTLWKGLATRILQGPPPALALKALKRNFGKAFYYDALPDEDTIQAAQNEEKKAELIATRDEQEELFRAIRRTAGYHVYEGKMKRRSRTGITQKQVDTMIAVDMLMHSYQKNAKRMTLIAGDDDFVPVVQALVLQGIYVTVWYEQRSFSSNLIEEADEAGCLGPQTLWDWTDREFAERVPMPREHGNDDHCWVRHGSEVHKDDGKINGMGLVSHRQFEDFHCLQSFCDNQEFHYTDKSLKLLVNWAKEQCGRPITLPCFK
ncbi:MAG: NYN domain-containing protein [Candidatus Thermoplasmatota archaeon]|nr:NYN domain-containing protein [Candidatus Thermoplasmatota archaeon]